MPRILIADDNSNIQKMVTLALQGAGIDVISVSNGGAAIRTLPDAAPDLVLADVFMPVRSGYEVCDFIKHEPRFCHVPVVLLVGAFDPLDESEAQRVSADGILKKPFIPPEPLINMVKSLLAKSLNERPEAFPVRAAPNAAPQEAPGPASRAAAPAVAEFSEEPAEEMGAPVLAPDFGHHEETLAFGSLLQMPAPPESAAQPLSPRSSPAAWDKTETEEEIVFPPALGEHDWGASRETLSEEEEPESLRPPGEFAGADIPEIDEIAGAEDEEHGADETFEVAASEQTEIGESFPEFGSELDSEPSSGPVSEVRSETNSLLASDFESVFGSGQGGAESEISATPAESMSSPWESAVAPLHTEQPEKGMPGEDLVETKMDRAGVVPEAAAEDSQVLEHSSAETLPSWLGQVVPVFPGSDKLWASPAEVHSEAKEAAKQEAEEEIPEAQGRAEAEPLWPSAVERSAFEPPSTEERQAQSVPAAVVPEVPVPVVPEVAVPAAELASVSALAVAPSMEAGTAPAVQPAMADPDLIEAVVTRIVERMQPKVIDVVTREILRPLVEALVRREINKNS